MADKHYFPRRCDVTGEGMNEGFCICNGEMYIKHESDLVAHLRTLDWEDSEGNISTAIESDEELKEYFYAEDYYYHTAWEDEKMEYVSAHADGRDAVEIALDVQLHGTDYVIYDMDNDQLITFSGGGVVIYGDKEDALRDCRGNEKVVSCTELPTKWKDVLIAQIKKGGEA